MAQEEIIFPNNIRKIRMGIGIRMTELARRAKLSLSAVSKIEKGVRRLNQKQLLNICNILGCKLSDIFIKESDEVAGQWQSEIRRRLTDNEGSGLKIFGSGLRKIRQKLGKTIARAARDANMTLSVYHKVEVGQREVYQDEIEPLAKSFGHTVDSLFNEIASLYKNGELNKQISKVKERIKSVLIPGSPLAGIDLPANLYGAKLYDSARAKLAPVFGVPRANAISLSKSDKTMIVAPITLEGRRGIYALVPNSKRLSDVLPEKCYVFADSEIQPGIGDMAVFIDADFDKIGTDKAVDVQIAVVRKDSKGKLYGHLHAPDERITAKTMHKVVMIVME
jgi:transcriptional regulator with XRE-family HTH domain